MHTQTNKQTNKQSNQYILMYTIKQFRPQFRPQNKDSNYEITGNINILLPVWIWPHCVLYIRHDYAAHNVLNLSEKNMPV